MRAQVLVVNSVFAILSSQSLVLGLLIGPCLRLAANIWQISRSGVVFLLFDPSKHYSVLCYLIYCTVVKLGGDLLSFILALLRFEEF